MRKRRFEIRVLNRFFDAQRAPLGRLVQDPVAMLAMDRCAIGCADISEPPPIHERRDLEPHIDPPKPPHPVLQMQVQNRPSDPS